MKIKSSPSLKIEKGKKQTIDITIPGPCVWWRLA